MCHKVRHIAQRLTMILYLKWWCLVLKTDRCTLWAHSEAVVLATWIIACFNLIDLSSIVKMLVRPPPAGGSGHAISTWKWENLLFRTCTGWAGTLICRVISALAQCWQSLHHRIPAEAVCGQAILELTSLWEALVLGCKCHAAARNYRLPHDGGHQRPFCTKTL